MCEGAAVPKLAGTVLLEVVAQHGFVDIVLVARRRVLRVAAVESKRVVRQRVILGSSFLLSVSKVTALAHLTLASLHEVLAKGRLVALHVSAVAALRARLVVCTMFHFLRFLFFAMRAGSNS